MKKATNTELDKLCTCTHRAQTEGTKTRNSKCICVLNQNLSTICMPDGILPACLIYCSLKKYAFLCSISNNEFNDKMCFNREKNRLKNTWLFNMVSNDIFCGRDHI